MSISPADLTAQPTAIGALPSSLLGTGDGRTPQRLVAKALRHLAKQLRKAAWKAAHPTAKQLRRALSHKLTAALAPLLNLEIPAGGDIAKAIDKTSKRLATQLVKHQRKQDKQAAKARRWAVLGPVAEPTVLPAEQAPIAPPAPKAAPKRPAAPLPPVPTNLGAIKANGVDGLAGLLE